MGFVMAAHPHFSHFTRLLQSNNRLGALPLTICVASVALHAADALAVPISWTGPASGNWSNAANWSGGVVPNNTAGTTYDVTAAGANITVNGDYGIDSLTLNSGSVQIGAGQRLTLSANSVNQGTIDLADGSIYTGTSADAYLRINGNVSLTGSGAVRMSSAQGNYIVQTNAGDSLTVGSGQTIGTNGAGTQGVISASLVNQGTVEANGGSLTVNSYDASNSGLMQARNSGTLTISGITVDNTGATIQADSTSTLNLNSATIDQGTIAVTGTGSTTVNIGGTVNLNDVDLSGLTAHVQQGDNLVLSGTVANNATLRLNDTSIYTGASVDAYLRTNGSVSLNGTGTIEFASNRGNYLLETNATDTLTLGANQTVTTASGGNGYIYVATVNNGLIDADGGTITLASRNKTNNNLMRARNGGTLNVNVDVNGSGGWEADGGRIVLNTGVDATTTGDSRIRTGGEIELNGNRLGTRNLTIDNGAILDVNSGVVSVSGDFSFAMTNEADWQWSGTADLEMTGGTGATTSSWAQWASLEIGGTDLGTDPANHVGAPAGFSNTNFYLPELIIGADAHVYLVDYLNNGNRGGLYGASEALFVDRLVFADINGLLNLNGLHLYYNTLVGSTSQIIDQTVALSSTSVPLPATAWMLLAGLLSLLGRVHRRG
jgi:hypothetical protein